MHRVALGIEYNGCNYHGWQRQANVSSIQQELDQALSLVANQKITTTAAGRTDAGVHAAMQVVHFDCSAMREINSWVYGANRYLPADIRVVWATKVANDFDARKTAISRHYRYFIDNNRVRSALWHKQTAWHYAKLDTSKMQQAAQYWLGEHDFSSFRGADCQSHTPIRQVKTISVVRIKDLVIVDIIANAFLHHMVRNMVGVLLKIGEGKADSVWAKQVLAAKDRRQAAITAPAAGLYLLQINYPNKYAIPQIPTKPLFREFNYAII